MTAAKRIFALPLVLLALFAQGWAPASAAMAAARMADPFANVPICSTDLSGAAKKDPGQPARHQDQPCALCAVCAPPAPALTAEAPVLPPPPASVALAYRYGEVPSARGPPERTPRARGPPQHA